MNKKASFPHQYLQLTTFNGYVPSELNADYILPDIFPDVKKILRISAKPTIISRFIQGKKLEYNGAVDYSVLFSAEGSETDTLHCVHFAGEWAGALGELESLDDANIIMIPSIQACNARLSNPRKISIRSTINTDINISSVMPCEPAIEFEGSMSDNLPEKLTKTVLSKRQRTFNCEPISISDSLEIDAAQPPIDSVVSSDMCIRFLEARTQSDNGDFSVIIKGDAYIDIIYLANDGTYRSFSRKIPINHMVNADDYAEYFVRSDKADLNAYASIVPIEIKTEVADDSYGERRITLVDATCELLLTLLGAETTELILDAYSTENVYSCLMKPIDVQMPAKVISHNFSVGQSVNRELLKLPEKANSIICSKADVTLPDISFERGRAIISGNAIISCIYTCDDGELGSFDTSLPIKCEVSLGSPLSFPSYSVFASAYDMRCRMELDKISFDFEVGLCAEIFDTEKANILESIKISAESIDKEHKSSIRVCYPIANENLWYIAKRYSITVDSLQEANKDPSKVLYIPNNTK